MGVTNIGLVLLLNGDIRRRTSLGLGSGLDFVLQLMSSGLSKAQYLIMGRSLALFLGWLG